MIFEETPIRENIVENHNQINMSTLREGRSVYLNFGRLCEDRDERSKSPKIYNNLNNVTHLSQNKGMIKNIESNVKKIIKKNL
jgi:hypothetical protein